MKLPNFDLSRVDANAFVIAWFRGRRNFVR
jgi:hypothetical protein